MERLFIVNAKRLPVCRSFGERIPASEGGDGKRRFPGRYGALSSIRMLAEALVAVASAPGLDPSRIDDILVGCALQDGDQGVNIARAASLAASLPQKVPAATLNRLCGSSLSAVMKGAEFLRAGAAFRDRKPGLVLAGGVEHMGRHDMAKAFEPDDYFIDHFVRKNPIALHMGLTAEKLAAKFGITREDQERFAWESHAKAVRAQRDGRFRDELIPMTLPDGSRVGEDEGPREYPPYEEARAGFAKLKPAFKEGGTVTAATAAPYSDGASAVVLATESMVNEAGFTPLAELVSWASVGLDPNEMGLGPVFATELALQRAGLGLSQLSFIELNEAFCAQALSCLRLMAKNHRMDEAELAARVNVNGGATALGHPLGATGTKLLSTLVWQLRRTPGAEYGLVTLCIGMGQGDALIIRTLR